MAPEGGGKDVFVHVSAVEKAGLNDLRETRPGLPTTGLPRNFADECDAGRASSRVRTATRTFDLELAIATLRLNPQLYVETGMIPVVYGRNRAGLFTPGKAGTF